MRILLFTIFVLVFVNNSVGLKLSVSNQSHQTFKQVKSTVQNCGNMEDEKTCTIETCGGGDRVPCPDGSKCFSRNGLCDRVNDCANGEDESQCTRWNSTSFCPRYMFSCPSESRRCISTRLVCDGNRDCENNADEEYCHLPCSPVQFHCGGEICIDKEKLCDGKDDCGNNEDERDCIINSELCWGDMFSCVNSSKCLAQVLVCNGKDNCGNNEDEMDCEDNEAELISPGLPALTNSERGCKHNQFLCPGLNITKCLNRSSVCDGSNDCGNNEDEINCNSSTSEISEITEGSFINSSGNGNCLILIQLLIIIII